MKPTRFSNNLLIIVLLIPLLCSMAGCVYLVIGGIGAVGGYIVSPDTVEGITDSEVNLVWDSAIETISIIGLINESDEASGVILANIHGAKITVTIISLSESSTKVTVKARKAYLPRISLAQHVFVKIMNHLEE